MARLVALLPSLLLAIIAAILSTYIAPSPACTIGSSYDLLCARGFETREMGYGESFRWSNETAEIHLPHAGYGSPMLLTLRLRSGRPAGADPVPAHIGIHGHSLADIAVPVTNRRYVMLVSPQFLVGEVAHIQLQSVTWKPNTLSRTFGLVLLNARLSPLSSGLRVPSLLLIASWFALFLIAQLTASLPTRIPNRYVSWFLRLSPMVVVLLCGPLPLLPLLPLLAVLMGVGVLAWRWAARVGYATSPSMLLWAIAAATPYILTITIAMPTWAKITLLGASGLLAIVGAGKVASSSLEHPSHPPLRGVGNYILSLALYLVISGALSRLLMLMVRLLSGNTRLDPDVELFYAYGMALRERGLPEVEYPAGALIPWAALSWLSGNSRELFALLLPLFNIACDMLIIVSLVILGVAALSPNPSESSRIKGEGEPISPSLIRSQWVFAPAAFYAFSPLLEPFVFGKYDPLPALLTVGALALFALRGSLANGLAGLVAGLGGMIKWTPLLVMPFLALDLLRQRRWYSFVSLVALHFAAIALCSLPFVLVNGDTFLMPYLVQGGRGMTGESIWMLVALLRDPTVLDALDAPWGMLRRGALSVPLMTGVQLGTLALLGITALLRPRSLQRTIILAALAPAIFFIVNRIFSPQYMLSISVSLLAALAMVMPILSRRASYGWLGLLVIAQMSNLLIWPLFVGKYWIMASVLMFVTLVFLSLSAWGMCYNDKTNGHSD